MRCQMDVNNVCRPSRNQHKQTQPMHRPVWRVCGQALTAAILILGMVVCACACGQPAKSTTITSSITEPTSPMVTKVTNNPTLTPSPSPSPIPAVPPLPSSVFIARESLPDGQIFPEGYYAILKGEGATYQVYDCRGKQAYVLTYTDPSGNLNAPNGLYTEEDLWRCGYMDPSCVKGALPPSEQPSVTRIRSFENGYFQSIQDAEDARVDLYRRDGQKIRSLAYESTGRVAAAITAYGSETVVCFSEEQKTMLYFVAADGKIRQTLTFAGYSSEFHGLIAEKYYMLADELYAMDGSLVKAEVTLAGSTQATILGSEGYPYIRLSDYFYCQSVLYNGRTMQPVPLGTTQDNGNLIEGASYLVDGITCIANWYDADGQIVAAGQAGDRAAIKTRDFSFSVSAPGCDYYAMMNHTLLVLREDDAFKFKVYALATGCQIAEISQSVASLEMADEYLLVKQENGFYILDAEGRVRLSSAEAKASPAAADCVLLYRGPYVGIADLNGDWLVKTLALD
jgi:hypothetical protein